MPLRMKCRNCGQVLILDEAFAGACCRCQHCHRLIAVPRLALSANRERGTRPSRPSPACKRSTEPTAAARTVDRRSLRPLLLRVGFRSPAVIASVIFVAVAGVTATVWHTGGRPSAPALDRPAIGLTDVALREGTGPSTTPENAAFALGNAHPLRTYFGIPLTGRTIGYVVDGDSAMASYIEDVAFVTNAVNKAMEPGPRRLGIVMAPPAGREERSILEVAEAPTGLVGARTRLTTRLPSEPTDLSRALATAGGWYADLLFLVIARPVDDEGLALLIEDVEQSGAVTHLIALGEAAKQDLSRVPEATGGRFLPLTDEMVHGWADRVRRHRQSGHP